MLVPWRVNFGGLSYCWGNAKIHPPKRVVFFFGAPNSTELPNLSSDLPTETLLSLAARTLTDV